MSSAQPARVTPPTAIRRFEPSDFTPMLDFARSLPEHDLLFLGRDLRHPRVVEAWSNAIGHGHVDSLVAEADGAIVATAVLLREPYGWSPHVGEVRLLVAADARRQGLGRRLLGECRRIAAGYPLAKLTARMTPDQGDAIALFEGAGFAREARLKDQVQGRDGAVHDIVILALDLRDR